MAQAPGKSNNPPLVRSPAVEASGGVSRRLRLYLLTVLYVSAILIATITAFRTKIRNPFEPNVAAEARAYLEERQIKPISAPLNELLASAAKEAQPTQPHPLLGKRAPDFSLPDDRGETTKLSAQLDKGCVVLIFYYGYHCNHCVGQLFAVHDDIKKFREIGATVLAVSADEVEDTQSRFAQYGRFRFPVLSDKGNQVASVYGIYEPDLGKELERLEHATFVIDPKGIIRWTNHGDEPFTDNPTLLVEIAKAQGRLPASKSPVNSKPNEAKPNR